MAEMEAMVSTILEEARLRTTSAALRMEPTDMVQLLQSVVDDFKDQAPGVECASLDTVTNMVDREKMRMVLRNLIDRYYIKDFMVFKVAFHSSSLLKDAN